MNYDILHELINRYENDMERIYGREHDELFKWKAMCTWRKEWLKSKDSFKDFSEQFTAAKKDFSLFIDNSRMHPSTGVLKLWEKEPETVEHFFTMCYSQWRIPEPRSHHQPLTYNDPFLFV